MLDLLKKLFKSSSKTRGSISANASPSTTPRAPASHTHGDSVVNLNLIASPIIEGHQMGPQNETKRRCMSYATTALELLKEISGANDVLAPLEAVCGVTLAILSTIEAIDKNKNAWKEVLDTIHKDRNVFEQQLRLTNSGQVRRDLDPELLASIQLYARNLNGILAAVMLEHGVSQQTLPEETGFRRLATFMKDYGTTKMDGDRITGYLKKLDEAMKHFNTSMGLHTAINMGSVDKGVQQINRKLSKMNLGSTSVRVATLKPRPALVDNFVGREDILEAMRQTHISQRSRNSKKSSITVLSGLGGAGKTQTALKFALEFEEKCPDAPVYFVNASAEETLKVDLENIIHSRGIEHRTASHEDALTWLATKPDDWLVIMDNADDPSLRLLSYIAQSSRGNVIITTRNSNQAMLAPNSNHHIEGLSMDDAIHLILTASGNPDTDANRALARAIVELLGHLPLALAQAAGYIFVHQCLSTYVVLFQESAENLLAERPSELPYTYPSPVAATIQMSLDRLPTHTLDILRLFSHLDSSSIPHAIISKSADRKFRRVEGTEECELSTQTREQAEALVEIFCVDGKWSELAFNNLIMFCLQYSLLRVTTQGSDKFYSMHILVQSYLRVKVDLVQGHRPGPLVVRLLGSSTTFSDDYKYLAFNRSLLPHLRQIRMEDVVEAGDHLDFGDVMRRAGDVQLAVLHLEQCVEMWRGSLGDEHQNTLCAMENLANSYAEIGSFQKALELEEKLLDLRRMMLGAEHPSTLVTSGNLVHSYRDLGRYEEAVELAERLLETRNRVLGPENASTIHTMASLALSYTGVGRNQEAMELQEQVLEIRKRILGPEDPYTLWKMCNLAELYRLVAREEEALELNRQGLEIQKRVLGDEHPDTLGSIRLRLYILQDLGMMEQFQALLQVALPAHEKVLGIDHPDTLQLREQFGTELALL